MRRAVLAAPLLLAACVVGPEHAAPQLALPAAYRNAPVGGEAEAAQRWWTAFHDAEMSRAVERALAASPDLELAAARIAQSRAQAAAAGAALRPRAELQASVQDVDQSLDSPIGRILQALPGVSRDYQLYDVGTSASWEIDLFGGLRRRRESAQAVAQAASERRAAMALSVAAETADAYLQLRAFQARLGVSREEEERRGELVRLTTRLEQEGVAADRELRRARASLEETRAASAQLRAGAEAAALRLDVLMGDPAGTDALGLRTPRLVPDAPSEVVRAPAQLLRERPDVRAAERDLAAADATIGAALAEYYPSISLTGALGVTSLDAGTLLTGDALQHTVAAGLRWRLFDFGRVDAEVSRARGARAEALAAWRGVVLRATGEVETAYSDQQQARVRSDALVRQAVELTRARDQARHAFREGVLSQIEVLDTDRDLLLARDQLVLSRSDEARAAVRLRRSLGA